MAYGRKQYQKDAGGYRVEPVRPTLTGWRGAASLMPYLGFHHLPSSLFPRSYRMVPIPNPEKPEASSAFNSDSLQRWEPRPHAHRLKAGAARRGVSEPGALDRSDGLPWPLDWDSPTAAGWAGNRILQAGWGNPRSTLVSPSVNPKPCPDRPSLLRKSGRDNPGGCRHSDLQRK